MLLNRFNGLLTKSFTGFITATLVLIASSTPEEHQQHLRSVLKRFSEHGVIINPAKCQFGASQLKFLGHLVDHHGIRPLEEKVQALLDFPYPLSKHKLREFLGLVSFFARLCPHSPSTQRAAVNSIRS